MLASATTSLCTVAVLVALLCGCGSSGHTTTRRAPRAPTGPPALTAATVCKPAAARAVAGYLRAPAAKIATAGSTGNNDSPQCSFTTPSRGGTVRLIANVSNAPSPYFVLERAAQEAAQIFGPTRGEPAPSDVGHLGLDAYWFPGPSQLMTTDGRLLITVTVSWPRTSQAREIEVSTALARTYLGPNDYAAAKLYP